ncbi:hypothetical protein [uncultured Ruegeria sp.]|uniref:hypothetical protein n=1 Tax=uncultured Ruegeria sp. TaxID=259304 RepID=UPI00262265B3|nr:hypothetical protein [uncultured Ruegeria sp.]
MRQELNGNNVVDFREARNHQHLSNRKLEVDVDKYEECLDKTDLSDQEKSEFLSALWTVLLAFVDLGYGIHPTQSATDEVINLVVEFADRKSLRQVAAECHQCSVSKTKNAHDASCTVVCLQSSKRWTERAFLAKSVVVVIMPPNAA